MTFTPTPTPEGIPDLTTAVAAVSSTFNGLGVLVVIAAGAVISGASLLLRRVIRAVR